MIDEILIDLGVKIVKVMKEVMGVDYDDVCDEILFWMFDEGCLGCKVNVGFYVYSEKGKCEGFWIGLG